MRNRSSSRGGLALFLAGLMIVSSIALATGPVAADSDRSVDISSPTWEPGTSAHGTDPARSGTSKARTAPNSAPGNTGHEPWYLYFRDVNTANGNLFRNHQDLSIGARGGDIAFVRSYNSNLSGRHSALGFGWTHNYAMELRPRDDGSVAFLDADGSIHVFESTSDGYAAPPGIHSRLTATGSGYDLWRTDGHRLEFDDDGTLQRITDANGNSVVLDYTGDRLTQIRDESGQALTLTYTPQGRIERVSGPLGRNVQYRYEAGDLVEVTDVMGHTHEYAYYENHKLRQVHQPNTPPVVYTYYAGTDRVRCVGLGGDRAGATCADSGFVLDYDYPNDTVTATNGLSGNTTKITLNGAGNPIRVNDPQGLATMAWDDDMNRVALRNQSGTYSSAYDAHGNLVRRTGPTGTTVRMDWRTIATDDTYRSVMVSRTGPRGYTTEYAYDDNGNLRSVTNPNGATRQLTYNRFGYPVSETDFSGHTTRYTYDSHGFRTAVIKPSGATTTYAYDAAGRLVARTDPNNHTYRYERNARGDVTAVTDPNGDVTTYQYDSDGALRRSITPDGNIIQGGAPWQPAADKGATIDRDDREVTMHADGNTVTRRFDSLGRLAEVVYDFGEFSRRLNYTYAHGNLAAIQTPNGTIRYTYDRLDRITRIDGASGAWVNYTYDAAGQRTKAVYSSGVTTEYAYNPDGQVVAITARNSTGSVLLEYAYAYDADGNRVKSTDTNGDITTYAYNALDRLVEVQYPSGKTVEFTYDAVGHRQTRTVNGTTTANYHYGHDGELRRITRPNATVTFDHDNDGKRTSRTDPAGTTRYSYSPAGRLESVSTAAGEEVSFAYMPNGERLSKTTDDGTTYYVYSFFDVVASFHENGTMARQYLHGPGIDDIVGMTTDGQRYFYHQDGTANVRAVSNERGRLVNRYDYSPYGRLRQARETIPNPYQFAGRRTDEQTGLHYNRHRYYDPATGRFTQRDPAGVSAGINLYGYAENNPITYRDPSGLDVWTGGLAGAGVMVVVVGAGGYYGVLYNTNTGQSCSVRVFNAKVGGGLGISAGIKGVVKGGPHCGKNLGGTSVSAYVSGSAGPVSGGASVSTQGGTSGSASGGAGTGGGLALEGGAMIGMVNVDDCSCECDCEPSEFCSDGQCDDPDDNPDDNHDLSVMSYDRQYPFGGESPPNYDYQGASVGVLTRGFSAELNDFLVSIDEQPASVGIRTSQAQLNRFNVLVIPTGGLQGISNLPSLERKLEGFVDQGGTLVVLPQKYGYDLEPVPGDLAGFGWREDQSCQFGSVGVTNYCSLLSGQTSSVSDINVDGYFTDYPDNASILLSRTKNGEPALLKYGYGNGRVIASAAYTDWAAGHHAAHRDGRRLLRDMIRWAKRPGNLTTYGAGDPVGLELQLSSYVDVSTDAIELRLIDPTGEPRDTIRTGRSLAPFDRRTISVNTAIPTSPEPGIWGVDYRLINETHGIVQQGRRPGHFAVSALQSARGGWAYQRSNLSVSVTSSAERFPRGSNASFTITVHNRGPSAENVTVWWSLPNNYDQTGDDRYGWPGTASPGHDSSLHRTLRVPAGTDRTVTYQAPVYAADDRLYAEAYLGNASSDRFIAKASKAVFTVRPTLDVTVAPERQRYAPGSNVSLDLAVRGDHAVNSTVAVQVVDASNRPVYRTTVNASLETTAAVERTLEFGLPDRATGGYYTVIADVQAEGQRVGYAANKFRVPGLIPMVVPSIPETLDNESQVSFTIENGDERTLSNATLAVSLTDPGGIQVWNASRVVSVPTGDRTTVSFDLQPGPLALGDYQLRYSVTHPDGSTATRVRTIPNEITTSRTLDQSAYDAGDTANVSVTVSNDGRFAGAQTYRLSIPAVGVNRTERLHLAPGGQRTFNYSVTLPESIDPGPHGTVAVEMATTHTEPLGLFVREPELAVTLGETQYSAGDTIAVELTNTGGVPTRANCSVSLYGAAGDLVADNRSRPVVDTAGPTTLSLAIPEQTVNGTSLLWTKCTDAATGRLTESLDPVAISGVAGSIGSTTDKVVYGPGESVTITTTISTGDRAIENGTVTIRIGNASANGSMAEGSTGLLTVDGPSLGTLQPSRSIAKRAVSRSRSTGVLRDEAGPGQPHRAGVASTSAEPPDDRRHPRGLIHDSIGLQSAATQLAIDNETVWRGTQRVLTEDLVINSTGNLTVVDTALRFDPPSDDAIGIEVRGGGELNVVGGSTIESLSGSSYTFVSRRNSRLTLRNATVRDVSGYPVEGIHVATSDASIVDSRFEHLDYQLFLDGGSGVTVRNNSFSTRLRLRGTTDATVAENRFSDGELQLRDTAGTTIDHNTFKDSYGDRSIDIRNGSNGTFRHNLVRNAGSLRLRDGSTQYRIAHNRLHGENWPGIEITGGSNYSLVRNNSIRITGERTPYEPIHGIKLASSHARLVGNTVTESFENGIIVSGVNVSLRDNRVTGSDGYDLLLDQAVNATLRNNSLGHSLHVRASDFASSPHIESADAARRYYRHAIDSSNTVNGGPVYYRTDLADTTIHNDGGMTWLVNATNVTVRGTGGVSMALSDGVTVTDVDAPGGVYYGVFAAFSNRTVVRNVTAEHARHGAVILGNEETYYSSAGWNSTGNVLADNDFSESTRSSIKFFAVADSIIRQTDGRNSGGYHAFDLVGANLTVVGNNVSGQHTDRDYAESQAVIFAAGSHHRIADNVIRNTSGAGLTVKQWSGWGERHNAVTGNVIHDTAGTAIEAFSRGAYVADNLATSETGYNDGIDIDAEHVTAAGNTIRDTQHGILISSPNPTIRDNTITDSTQSGVSFDIYYDSGVTVVNNTVSRNGWAGILIDGVARGTIRENEGADNFRGIDIEYSQNVTLTDNAVGGSGASIRLSGVQNATLEDNALGTGGLDIPYDSGSTLAEFDHDIDSTNTFRGEPVYYLVGADGVAVPRGAGAVWIVDSTNVTAHGGHHATVAWSQNVTVRNQRVADLATGIRLLRTVDSRVVNATVENVHSRYRGSGVQLVQASGNRLRNVTVRNSSLYGVRMATSKGNKLRNVSVINNQDTGVRLSRDTTDINLVGVNASYNQGHGIAIHSSGNTLTDITAIRNDEPGYGGYSDGIWVDGSANVIADVHLRANVEYGIEVVAANNTITGVTSEEHSDGILLAADRNTVANVRSVDDGDAVDIESSDNHVRNVTAWDTGPFSYGGVTIDGGDGSVIANSNLSDVGVLSGDDNTLTGTIIRDSVSLGRQTAGNLIYNNYFMADATGYDSGDNRWNVSRQSASGDNILGGDYLGGNFWADYSGLDLNGDGIGDTELPYKASGNIEGGGDYHPLVVQESDRSTGPVVWSTNVSVDAPKNTDQTLEFTVPASVLSEVDGKLKLTSLLESETGQSIATEDPAFYVIEGDTIVTLESDRQEYDPGETVTLTGRVKNTASTARNLTLTVKTNGSTIETRDLTLGAGETETYSVTTTSQGPFTATAVAGTTTVSDRIAVRPPRLNATIVAPAVVGREAFTAGVLLENTGRRPVTVDVGIANQSQGTITIPAGSSQLVQRSMQLEASTRLNVSLSGDLTRTLTQPIVAGEQVSIDIRTDRAYTPGSVRVPYTIENEGRYASSFPLTVEVGDRTIRNSITVPGENRTSGVLRFNLTTGDYPLNYSTPFTTNETTLRVTPRNQLQLNLTHTGPVTDGRLPVNVTVHNTGPNDVYGSLRANATVFTHATPFNLSAGATRTVPLSIPISGGAPQGSYNLSLRAVSEGSVIATQTGRFAIHGPQIEVVSGPRDRSLTVGDRFSGNVTVVNTGGAAGVGRINVSSPGLHRSNPSIWLAPGERGNVSIRFTVPTDLSSGTYNLHAGTGAERKTTTLTVDGLAVDVTGALDAPVYDEGDNASLTLQVDNPTEHNLSLFSRVQFNGYDRTKPLDLDGGASTTLTFDVPISFGGDEKIFYSVYAESGRSLYINGIRPHRNASTNVTVYTDEPVYDIGDTVTVRIQAHTPGKVTVSAPGESRSWQNLSAGANTSFNFEVPALTSGTHYIHYSFDNRSYSYPFDVDGYHARLVETTLEDGQLNPDTTANLSLRLESNRAIDGSLNASLYDADGELVSGSQTAVSLPSGTTTVTVPVTVPADANGIYAVRYHLEGTVNPTFDLLTGTEFVEVQGEPTPENRPPHVAFTTAPVEPIVNQSVLLNASAAVDPDGRITRYAWHLDNDSVPDVMGVTATHAFTSPGTHLVRLTVTDDDGRTNTTTRQLHIDPAPPEKGEPEDGNETDAPGGGTGGPAVGGGGTGPSMSKEPGVDVVATDGTIRITIANARSRSPIPAAMPGQASPVGPGYGLTAVNVTLSKPGSVELAITPGDRGLGAVNENTGDVGAFTVDHTTGAGIEAATIGFYVSTSRLQQLGLAPDAIALYRSNGTAWTRLPTSYLGSADGQARYRALSPDGFSVFAISAAATVPPTLAVVDSTLGATEVAPGQPVTITSTVENTGDRTGSFVIDLVVDGQRTAQTTVTLGPGERTTVEFAEKFDQAEQYSIAIGETSVGDVSVVSTSTPGAETARPTTQPTTPVAQQPTDDRTVTTQQPGPVFEPGGVQFVPIAAILLLLLVVSIGWYARRYR